MHKSSGGAVVSGGVVMDCTLDMHCLWSRPPPGYPLHAVGTKPWGKVERATLGRTIYICIYIYTYVGSTL